MNDFFVIFSWWAIIAGLGLIFLPLTAYFFRPFFDSGYSFTKILGLLITTYLIWLLASLKILAFNQQTIWLVILAAAAVNYLIFKKQKPLKKAIQKKTKIFIFEEILFFLALFFWASIRGFQPYIQGLEKFMDFGFVNTLLRSSFFPPKDMWLAGQSVNYYYFGHLVTAVLTKISGLNSAITYNLMIASLFAFSLSAGFGIGSHFIFNLAPQKKKTIIGLGLFTSLLLTLGGNLHPLYWWLKEKTFTTYWYPDATRFIVEKFGALDNTIHEFPIYSFVVADLHGHLLNLPFVLLFIALILSLTFTKKFSWQLKSLLALLLGCFYMTNAWDFPIYLLIFGLTVFYLNLTKQQPAIQKISQTVKVVAPIFGLALILTLPYHLHFKNIAQGIMPVDFRSPGWMLPVLWGLPLITSFCFFSFCFLAKKKFNAIDNLLLIFLGVAWFLIIIPEFIYVKDIYIHSHQRANTMFKLTYQSFVIFSLVTPYILYRVSAHLQKKLFKFLLITFFLLFITFVFLYPNFAIHSYYGLKTYQGLDGLIWLKNTYPDDYQAILWLRQNIDGQPVIVEAVGESYTDFARVSANTGLPTILGWRVHEWLWRGSFDEAGKRTEIVREIYESEDLNKTKQLLNQYRVEYIFLGDLEKQQYPQLQTEKFNQLGETVFASGETKVIKSNQ